MPDLTYVLTDIHGRFDLLKEALAEIESRDGDKRLIFLGDYVDRGPQSRQVIECLVELDRRENVVCLFGNHEAMFVDFVTALRKRSRKADDRFLASGGRETLDSYVDSVGTIDFEAMKAHASWMKTLPLWHKDETRVYVHAGVLPGEDIESQPSSVLIWSRMHDFFFATRKLMGMYVVHGHTPVHDDKDYRDVEVTEARTNLDTGAYRTGKLTIGVFDDRQEQPVEVFSIYGSSADFD